MRTAIMTDTNSGITTEEGKSLGIFVIPMPIIIDDKVIWLDFKDAIIMLENSGVK